MIIDHPRTRVRPPASHNKNDSPIGAHVRRSHPAPEQCRFAQARAFFGRVTLHARHGGRVGRSVVERSVVERSGQQQAAQRGRGRASRRPSGMLHGPPHFCPPRHSHYATRTQHLIASRSGRRGGMQPAGYAAGSCPCSCPCLALAWCRVAGATSLSFRCIVPAGSSLSPSIPYRALHLSSLAHHVLCR